MNRLLRGKDKIINENIIKDVRKFFTLEKENKEIKDKIIRDIRHFLEVENEEEDY